MFTLRRFVWTLLSFVSAGTADASLIWDGDASRGTGIFKLIGSNCGSPGSVSAVDDPTHGRVWRYHKPSGSDRCESHGIRVNGSAYTFQNGSTYYLGWRYRLSSTVNNNAQFQWKVFPAPGPAGLNWPLALKVVNDRAVMLNRKGIRADGSYEVYEIWSSPIVPNTWYHMVVGVRLSNVRDGGWVEVWLNGVQQTLLGGTSRWACRLYDTDHVCPKWGVYGASETTVNNYVDALRIGTTYGDVGLGTPPPVTPTPTPTVTPTPVTPTPTPTPTSSVPGDIINITPPASAVTASTHDGNLPANTVDGSLATRWSGNGDGQWLQYELSLERPLSFVQVAVYNGNARRNRFEIQVSTTPGFWTTVFNGESSGTTTQKETYDFPDVNARWVRYLGHGNVGSTNPSMNSVTEVSLHGPAEVATATPTPAVTSTPMPTPTPTATPTPPSSPVNLTPPGSAVSASTNDGNVPANTVDGSLTTRWSANGDGQWIQYDLGGTRTLSSVRVAWYQGNSRASTFDVLASDSAAGPWSTLLAGRQSSGTTTALEAYDFTDAPGRFLRIVGHGNTTNAWNSLTEVQVWGN